MQKIILNKFGLILTGRPYGIQTYADLEKEHGDATKIEFDFTGIVSLGSGFGEEVLVPFAKRQGNKLIVKSASNSVKSCIQLIASDFSLSVDFK